MWNWIRCIFFVHLHFSIVLYVFVYLFNGFVHSQLTWLDGRVCPALRAQQLFATVDVAMPSTSDLVACFDRCRRFDNIPLTGANQFRTRQRNNLLNELFFLSGATRERQKFEEKKYNQRQKKDKKTYSSTDRLPNTTCLVWYGARFARNLYYYFFEKKTKKQN